jgi:Arc/MetJ-type ribon-helix-helix transcriptional regulator
MSITIPSDLCDYVQRAVATGVYHDEVAMVTEALRLLQRRDEFRQQIQIGLDQLNRGEVREYDDEGLKQRLEEIKADGRRRIAGDKGAA